MNAPARRLIGQLVLAFFLLASASCGRKTDPLVPASPRPEAVTDIKVDVRDAVAFLSWPVPTKNIEGKEMKSSEIVGFLIFRAEGERDKKRPRYRQVAEIDMSNPAPATVRGGTVSWSDSTLRYDQVYSYRIRVVSARGGVSAWSEEVRVAPLLSLAAPKKPIAAAGDGSNELAWDAVITRTDGSAYTGFVGYNVYRGTDKGREEDKPLNKEPLRTNTYKDTSVVNDKTYYYTVRAVDSPTPPWKESLDSPEVSAAPQDRTPPERPTGLTVVPGVGRIFLTWNENKERDLAGYYVYRSSRGVKGFERLTEKPISRTTYSDETAKPGVLYHYAVTAVDQTGNESPRSKEQSAVAERAR